MYILDDEQLELSSYFEKIYTSLEYQWVSINLADPIYNLSSFLILLGSYLLSFLLSWSEQFGGQHRCLLPIHAVGSYGLYDITEFFLKWHMF